MKFGVLGLSVPFQRMESPRSQWQVLGKLEIALLLIDWTGIKGNEEIPVMLLGWQENLYPNLKLAE